MNFIATGSNAVGSLNMRLPVPLEHRGQPDGTTWAYKNFVDVNVALHEAAERSGGDSTDLITDERRLEQHFHATGNVRNDRNDVSVWENLAGTILPHNGSVRRDSDDVSVWELANRSNHLDHRGWSKRIAWNEQVLFDVWTSQAYMCAHGTSGCLQEQDLCPVTRVGEGHDLISAKNTGEVGDLKPSPTPSTSYPRSQACRIGAHASGARKTASCKIPDKEAYRVRLPRFEGACSESVGLVRLGWGGSSTYRLVRIAISSVLLSMRSHMFVSCSTMPSVLVGAAWAASCEDDTNSGVSLAIGGPGRSMICSTVCSTKKGHWLCWCDVPDLRCRRHVLDR